MSLDIRHLTNGEKTIYTVRDSLHMTFNVYNTLEEVPEDVRHYAETTKLQFAGPDLARVLGSRDVLYPNFPDCGHPEYLGEVCIAESCKYGDPTYKDCPYFGKVVSCK